MSKSETTGDDCWTAADLVAWLRVEGRARQGMEADEAQWCSRLNEAADEIERTRAALRLADKALAVTIMQTDEGRTVKAEAMAAIRDALTMTGSESRFTEGLKIGKVLGLRFAEKQLSEAAARHYGSQSEAGVRHALERHVNSLHQLADSEESNDE